MKFFLNNVFKTTNKSSTLYYFDPPYFITQATYNDKWTINDEKRLYIILGKMIKGNKKFVFSNQLISKGKYNILLLNFLVENKEKITVYNANTKFVNSNYQRKNNESNFDLEIIVTSGF